MCDIWKVSRGRWKIIFQWQKLELCLYDSCSVIYWLPQNQIFLFHFHNNLGAKMFSKLLRQILAPGCSLLVTFSVPPMQCRDIDCYITIFQIDCSITNFLWNYIFDFVDVLLFDTTMHCKDLPRRINLDRTFCFSKPKQQFSKPKLKIYWGWRWLWFWEKTVCWSLVAWCTSNGVGGLGTKKTFVLLFHLTQNLVTVGVGWFAWFCICIRRLTTVPGQMRKAPRGNLRRWYMPSLELLVLVAHWRTIGDPSRQWLLQAQIGDWEDYIKPKPDVSPTIILNVLVVKAIKTNGHAERGNVSNWRVKSSQTAAAASTASWNPTKLLT